jgi:hypothetical protein
VMARKKRNSGFWECMIVTESGCWEWQGYREPGGYGQIRINGKLHKTHRLAFELTYGESPLVVRHTCDNPPCCNPNHLLGGTHADNVADKIERGRGRCGNLRGEQIGNSKLTTEDVLSIRANYKTGNFTLKELGEQHGVTYSMAWLIVHRKKWKHI